LFFMPILTILLSDLKQNEIASGSGLATFLRTLGGSFSASLTTVRWERRAVTHHAQRCEHIIVYSPTAQAALNQYGQGNPQVGAVAINQIISLEGYQVSFNEVFHVLGWVFCSLVLVIWLTRPPFIAKAGPAAAGH